MRFSRWTRQASPSAPSRKSTPSLVTYQWVAWKAAPGEMKVGTYTGNGARIAIRSRASDSRRISSLSSPVAADQPVHKVRAGPAANAFTFEGVLSTNYIPTLGADGFTVGNDVRVNRIGTTYHYVAWNELPGKVDVGTYTGNGADNRNIPGVGFQPDFVMVQTNNGLPTVAHSTAMGALDSTSRTSSTRPPTRPTRFKLLQPDGFQVGSAPESNGNNRIFTYAAWGSAAPTAVRMAGMSARRTAKGVVIEWRTGYEVDNLGFHVYRGREGEPVRLTTSLLAGSGSAGVARHRAWRRSRPTGGATTPQAPGPPTSSTGWRKSISTALARGTVRSSQRCWSGRAPGKPRPSRSLKELTVEQPGAIRARPDRCCIVRAAPRQARSSPNRSQRRLPVCPRRGRQCQCDVRRVLAASHRSNRLARFERQWCDCLARRRENRRRGGRLVPRDAAGPRRRGTGGSCQSGLAATVRRWRRTAAARERHGERHGSVRATRWSSTRPARTRRTPGLAPTGSCPATLPASAFRWSTVGQAVSSGRRPSPAASK